MKVYMALVVCSLIINCILEIIIYPLTTTAKIISKYDTQHLSKINNFWLNDYL